MKKRRTGLWMVLLFMYYEGRYVFTATEYSVRLFVLPCQRDGQAYIVHTCRKNAPVTSIKSITNGIHDKYSLICQVMNVLSNDRHA